MTLTFIHKMSFSSTFIKISFYLQMTHLQQFHTILIRLQEALSCFLFEPLLRTGLSLYSDIAFYAMKANVIAIRDHIHSSIVTDCWDCKRLECAKLKCETLTTKKYFCFSINISLHRTGWSVSFDRTSNGFSHFIQQTWMINIFRIIALDDIVR